MKLPTTSFHLAALAAISLVTPVFAVVNINNVTVGNAGNAADPTTGYGAVAYTYAISKYETTISQYAEFLNAKAQTDTYGLYNTNMGSNLNIAGITRTGVSGSYSYSVVAGSGNRPISYVSWFDAARFTNWLQNGQGSGSTETGAYTLSGATSGIFTKNVGATVWIPSENEWYKAAYYDPTPGAGGGDNYWLYPTQSNTVTNNTVSANYFDNDYVGSGTSSVPTGNALTNVGAYGAASDSYYGTLDQGGNVWEWNDAVIFGSSRGVRGGAWAAVDYPMTPTARVYADPSLDNSNFAGTAGYVGFRVATIPEPSSFILALLTSGALLLRRKRG